MSKKFRLNPKDATYKGCYQAKTKDGLIVYWVKVYMDGKDKWVKVGYSNDGITPKYVKQFRGAHTTENIHKVLPTKHRRLPGQEAHCG
jgi:hypothetical protein